MLAQKEFIDVTAEIPSPDELEIPDLPTAPDATTYAPIRRARGKQTLADADLSTSSSQLTLGLRQDVPAPHHFVPPATGSASQPSVIAPVTSLATSQPSAMPSVIVPATSSATSQPSAIAPATSAGASLPVNDYGAGGETAEMVDDSPPLTASEAKKQKLEFLTSNGLKPWNKKHHMRSLSMMFSAVYNPMTGSVYASSWTWTLAPTVSRRTFSVILCYTLFASSTPQKFP